MLTAESDKDKNTLHLRVKSNAVRNEMVGFTDGVLQVRVSAPPVKGEANKELCDFLSHALGISKSSLTIIKGHTSRNKIIAIEGLNHEEIIRRLTA